MTMQSVKFIISACAAVVLAASLPGLSRAEEPASAAKDTHGMRLDYRAVAPGVGQALMGLEEYVRASGLEKSLLNLVKIRVSQINGCAYCLDLHAKDARETGETAERLAAVENWQTATVFSSRERAALEWAESLTLISQRPPSAKQVQAMLAHFSDKELADLSLAIIAINGWNRLNISFREEPQFCPAD